MDAADGRLRRRCCTVVTAAPAAAAAAEVARREVGDQMEVSRSALPVPALLALAAASELRVARGIWTGREREKGESELAGGREAKQLNPGC